MMKSKPPILHRRNASFELRILDLRILDLRILELRIRVSLQRYRSPAKTNAPLGASRRSESLTLQRPARMRLRPRNFEFFRSPSRNAERLPVRRSQMFGKKDDLSNVLSV